MPEGGLVTGGGETGATGGTFGAGFTGVGAKGFGAEVAGMGGGGVAIEATLDGIVMFCGMLGAAGMDDFGGAGTFGGAGGAEITWGGGVGGSFGGDTEGLKVGTLVSDGFDGGTGAFTSAKGALCFTDGKIGAGVGLGRVGFGNVVLGSAVGLEGSGASFGAETVCAGTVGLGDETAGTGIAGVAGGLDFPCNTEFAEDLPCKLPVSAAAPGIIGFAGRGGCGFGRD